MFSVTLSFVDAAPIHNLGSLDQAVNAAKALGFTARISKGDVIVATWSPLNGLDMVEDRPDPMSLPPILEGAMWWTRGEPRPSE